MHRDTFTDKSTISPLFVDGEQFCYILEDADRHLEEYPEAKVYGQTAVPRGTYKIILDFSSRFQRILPRLLDVPGFEGVRIHPGNTGKDTEGCLLPGFTMALDWVGPSVPAFTALFQRMEEAESRNEEISIIIT
jgi:hypothetical protein